MTLRGRLIMFFPLVMVTLIVLLAVDLIRAPSFTGVALLLFVLYLLPPLCFRIHNWVCPLREGKEDLSDDGRYSAWWGSQQFQIAYSVIPQLEGLLRLVPGGYSAWLRLWGSEIGRGVFWAPVMQVIDRSLLCVGDRVFFGYETALVCHTVTPKAGRQVLRVLRIHVGSGAFVAGRCGLGPGARVPPDAYLRFGSQVYFGGRSK